MDSVRNFFERLKTQFGGFWSSLTVGRKALVGAVGVGILVGLGALVTFQEAEPRVYIFKDLPATDVSDIIAYFERNSIVGWDVDEKGVSVPQAQSHQLRMKLAQEGLPTGGAIGYEQFDEQNFATTDFVNNIMKLRAIQGELQRMIQMVDGVNTAKVNIVVPKKSVFIEDQMEPTAAIFLKTQRGKTLSKKQIKGIQHLVSKSVEGLKPNNVTITDGEGVILTEEESNTFASRMTRERMAYKNDLQKRYTNEIRRIVGRIVGPDRVEVSVNVEVDMTQEQLTISEVDPESAVAVSKEVEGSTLSGTGLNETGIPGAKSNVPGEQEEIAQAGNSTTNKTDKERVNYELSKTVSQQTGDVGKVIRISASVLVDGKQEYPLDETKPVFEPRTAEELDKIKRLAINAVGLDEKRGDTIEVVNEMFQLDQFQIESVREEKKEKRQYLWTLLVSSGISIALVLFFAFIVRPYFRWLSYDPERKKEQQAVEEFKPDLELGALQNVQIKEDVPFEKLSPTEQVLYLAKNEPKRTTEALRLMLNPHHGA